MKAHLIDTHLVPRSRSPAKVKVKYQGHVSQKMHVSGPLVFHKHILLFLCVVATGFPAGQTPLKTRLDEIRLAVEDGAREIDIVINRQLALAGNWKGTVCVSISFYFNSLPNRKVLD